MLVLWDMFKVNDIDYLHVSKDYLNFLDTTHLLVILS